ncbi:hypothetical protein CROQUDRAFT_136515 [Cronartium quercuum f. sp. fusiforme G11]|uniref:N(6)-L-threonylcarbamoyladenine synthase n=1 Tax=Cronartium quercuum f. sp. fusiforme G11 TaxID=708437 RepID=A0A9P6N848_9BASI|nr:hypothetical protein CROQUDRAFT_136515 [Cronartium quercuum f. sp. fusiforme G11]
MLSRILIQKRLSSFTTKKTKRILAIESSCDDSCASIITSNYQILSNITISQNEIHKPFNGIHPYHAINAHQLNIPLAVKEALRVADLKVHQIDAVAYTKGPGIAGCLAVGATAAKTLSATLSIPLISVHHMQAHALTALLINQSIKFPFLTLLVSGGHTLLCLVKSSYQFKILCETADEAIGCTIDKISREIVGKGKNGKDLEKFISEGNLIEPDFTLPIASKTNYNQFSFCGIRTATLRKTEESEKNLSDSEQIKRGIGKSFLISSFSQLERKTHYWLNQLIKEEGVNISGLVLSGGVASNLLLRKRMEDLLLNFQDLKLFTIPIELCGDNAAMIGYVGLDKLSRGKIGKLDEQVKSKWSIELCED